MQIGVGRSEVAEAWFRLAATKFLVYFDPAAFAPVAAALMFAPAVLIVLVFGPSPIVGTNGEPEIRVEMMSLPDMPAIAFTIADDFCGCGGWYQSQREYCAQDGGENTFHK
jgi:hypothetical protein